MVGLPNRAARCGICQGHKIKCDLSRPDCSRCKRLGLSCKYPDLQRGQIFVNRNLNNPRVKAVDILSTASTGTKKNANNLGNAYSTSLMTAIKRSHDKQNNSVPHPISSEDVDRIQLLSTFVDLHLPKAQGPILRPDAQSPATWINCLGDLASNSNTFDTSLKALCLAQIGLWHHDLGLMKESRRLYGSALRGLRDAVSHQKLEFPKATLATIIILSTYELFSVSSEKGQGWVSHARGGSKILQSLGPSILSNPVGLLLCLRLRTIGIFESFRSRKTSFLTGLHFSCPTDVETPDLYCQLQDLMIQIPPILETFDSLTNATINKITESTILSRLLQQCSGLHAQLLAWCEVLRERVPGQLYTSIPSIAHNPADTFGARTFPLAFHFPTLNIAQLLLLYWSTLIILYRTKQDISLRLKLTQPGSFPSQWKSSLSPSPLQEEARENDLVLIQHGCLSDDDVAALAKKICQSFEYCYKSTNGTLGVQSTIFPRWVATDFYASRNKYKRELEWCEGVENMTAPESRFDVRVAKFGDMAEFQI